MNEKLSQQHCVPCEGGMPPMPLSESEVLLSKLKKPWTVLESGKKIHCEFSFKDFTEALSFVNQTASIAEEEGHHPDIHISYNKVTIELWTHAVGGLSKNDFILAAKIENIPNKAV